MPIVDMRQFTRLNKQKKRRSKSRRFMLLLLVVGLGGLLYAVTRSVAPMTGNGQADTGDHQPAIQARERKLRHFTPEAFNRLALAVKYPNTQLFEEPPIITGDKTADDRIRELAEARGYTMTSMPVGPIQKIDEPRLEGDDLLQPLAAESWRSLKAAAARADMPLSLTSAYRSPQYQRDLFMSRLKSRGVTVPRIIAGKADQAIEAVLTQAAIPGYSRHHTGYTIDLWCEDGSPAFLVSACFRWISADNYKIAKENGWIPSYPEGVELQGPEPEPWEYVWVGEDLVRE